MEAKQSDGRQAWIDHLKAWAIIAVIFTHARRAPWQPTYGIWDFMLGQVWTAFHVPSFLFVSGFLYFSGTPVGVAEIGRRAGRILVPYLVASALALYPLPTSETGLRAATRAILTGSASPFYYYIVVLCSCLPLIWFLSRVSRAALQSACVVLLAATWLRVLFLGNPAPGSDAAFWIMRDPIAWFAWGWFVLGWTAAAYEPAIRAFAKDHPLWTRVLVTGCFVVWVVVLVRANVPTLARDPIAGIDGVRLTGRIAFTLAVIAWFSLLRPSRPANGTTRLLSESTLMIYLAHPFFLELASPWVETWMPALRIGVLVVVMTLGCVCTALAARASLGPRISRQLLGA